MYPSESIGFKLIDQEEFELGSFWERNIVNIIESEGKLTAQPYGKGSMNHEIINVDHSRIGPPDLLIRGRERRGICWIEITGSRRRRAVFLIQYSKVKKIKELYLPIFFIFYINESDELYWCEGAALLKYRPKIVETNWNGERVLQRVIATPKDEWHHGMKSLIRLLKFLERERGGRWRVEENRAK